MFATDYLFDLQRLSDFGCMICSFDGDLDTASGGDIEFNVVKAPNRDRYTFYGSQMESVLTWNFSICKNPCLYNEYSELFFDQYEESMISNWMLKRDGYHWLQFDQEGYEDISYNVQVTSMTPHQIDGKTIGFDLSVVSDCGYGFTNEIVKKFTINSSNSYTLTLHTDMTEYVLPYIVIDGNGKFKINNENDTLQSATQFKNINDQIVMDSDNNIITGINDFDEDFNWYFLRLVNGDNKLTTDSSSDIEIEIIYREARRVIV